MQRKQHALLHVLISQKCYIYFANNTQFIISCMTLSKLPLLKRGLSQPQSRLLYLQIQFKSVNICKHNSAAMFNYLYKLFNQNLYGAKLCAQQPKGDMLTSNNSQINLEFGKMLEFRVTPFRSKLPFLMYQLHVHSYVFWAYDIHFDLSILKHLTYLSCLYSAHVFTICQE